MKFYKETKFKDSKIGRIPKEWEVVKIGGLGKVITGTTPRTKIKDYWDGTIPFVTPTDISQNKYVYKTERKVTEKGAQIGRVVSKDSVLMTCIASVGKVALAYEECITNQQINTIVCQRGIDHHYVYYILTFRKKALRDQAGATTNAIVKKSLFEEFLISIPKNYNEQQKIASILSTVDEAIQKTDQIIQKTQGLKKGLMQELLTKGIRHKKFKYSEELDCEIPKEWNVVRLGDVSTEVYRYPTYYNIKYVIKGTPEVRGELIKENGTLENDLTKYRFISKEMCARFPRTVLEEGDFALSVRATMGKVAIVPKELQGANITANLIRISPNRSLLYPHFLKQFFLSEYFQKTLNNLSSQTTIKTIKAPVLKSIELPLPSLPEQKKIASILSDMDEKIEKEKQTRDQLEKLKKGLMQILLTGKVRVRLS